jgi:hypothetical protein
MRRLLLNPFARSGILSSVERSGVRGDTSAVSRPRFHVSLSRLGRITVGVGVALALFAAGLGLLIVVLKSADGTSGEWARSIAQLLFVLAAASLVGLVVAVALAGLETVRRIPGAHTVTLVLEWLGSATILALLTFVALVGGGLALVVFIVGGTAAAGAVLYVVGDLLAYLFAISLRWGVVIACGLLVLLATAGGLIHDVRLEVTPPQAPPKEHE